MTAGVPRPLGWLRILLELSKARITVGVMLTTAVGYVLAAGRLDVEMWAPVGGTFLLASGSCALNQWQERKIDARMSRTRGRPLPAGRMEPTLALFVSILLILAGLSVVTSVGHCAKELLAIGGLAVLWYNGAYTYLKRFTAFAVVPGALIGALPPAIGYLAAGGHWGDPVILLTGLFLFVWQVPHFWLLHLMTAEQYRRAGLPVLTDVFSAPQLARITSMWLLAAAMGGLTLLTLKAPRITLPWNLVIVLASLGLMSQALSVLKCRIEPGPQGYGRLFSATNLYALIVMLSLLLHVLTA